MQPKLWLKKFLIWRVRNIKHQQFVLILAAITGVLSGLAAITVKNSAHFIINVLKSSIVYDYQAYLYFIYPLIGILLVILFIKYILRRPIGEGVPEALFAISKRSGFIKAHNMFSSIVSSALTVGFGGSAGLEGPSVATGTALGSNLGKLMHVNYKTRILLLACAAAGTMSAIFNAPIAAIIFALEILLLDLTLSSLLPLLISSASASIFSHFMMGGGTVFSVKLNYGFEVSDTLWYILLGIVCGFVSIYVIRVSNKIADYFKQFASPYKRWILAGSALGLLILVMPPLYGEGYEIINALLDGNGTKIISETFWSEYANIEALVLALILGLVFFKIIATSLTFAAGGIGGIFAPTLFMGSCLGFVFAATGNLVLGTDLPLGIFALVGMAGLMAGILHAPLMAIFLIAEITSGYTLFVPLMIASSIAYLTSKYFQKHSIYTSKLTAKGELLTHHADKNVLTLLKLEKLVERNFQPVTKDMTLGELVTVIAQSKRNVFPVLNEEKELIGILSLDNIRTIMFDHTQYDTCTVADFMHSPLAVVDLDDDMSEVMEKFRNSGLWNLAVLKDKKYEGFVSKSKLFSSYRSKLREFSQE